MNMTPNKRVKCDAEKRRAPYPSRYVQLQKYKIYLKELHMQIFGKILLSVFIYGAIGVALALATSPGSLLSQVNEITGLIFYHLLVVIVLYFVWF